MVTKKTELNFEAAIKELEQIIDQIENGGVDLETALTHYQKGVDLVKFCQNKLQDVEQKIKMLDYETNQLKELNAE